jgi:hypothetical protein
MQKSLKDYVRTDDVAYGCCYLINNIGLDIGINHNYTQKHIKCRDKP